MTLEPRQTGSSQKFFILAAALQAGAQPLDQINGTTPCTLPNPGQPEEPFEITDAAGPQGPTLDSMTWWSINCAYARLVADRRALPSRRHDLPDGRVGLSVQGPAGGGAGDDPADPRGRDWGQPDEPARHGFGDADGAQRRGAQRAVLRRAHREVRAAHLHPRRRRHPGPRSWGRLDRGRRAQGRPHHGTGRRYPMDAWSAAGKTGTQDRNTNAWFVGGTPYLSTAVWMGDPDGYTPMVGIPELVRGQRAGRGPRWTSSDQDLEDVHGPRPRGPRRPPTGRRRLSRPVLRRACTCRATSASAGWSDSRRAR